MMVRTGYLWRPAVSGSLETVRAFRAELLKLRKRRAVWVLLLILVVTVVFLNGYMYNYLTYIEQAAGIETGGTPGESLATILPGSLIPSVLDWVGYWDWAVAIVLGGLVAGGEYSWGTLKTMLTQRPPRLSTYIGKVLALWVVIAGMVIVVFAIAALTSVVLEHVAWVQLQAMLGPEGAKLVAPNLSGENQQYVQLTVQQELPWPSLWEVLRGMGAEWLMLGMYASMAFMFAILSRSAAIGMAVGFGYWVLQAFPATITSISESMYNLSTVLPGTLTTVLQSAFGLPGGGDIGVQQGVVNIDAGVAARTMAVYVLIFVVIGGLVLRFRDVR